MKSNLIFKVRLYCSFFIILNVTSFLNSSGQNTFIGSLKDSFNTYNSVAYNEKVYVHTDKQFYMAGETIWFKIYNVESRSNKPVTTSKVVFIEILDKQNRVAIHSKIALEYGSGNGSFTLSTSIATGNYLMRAYTAWMKNFSSQYYFQKEITIVNTFKRPDWQELEKKEAYDVNFFPEGGNLVNGIKSKLAFKVTDQYGKGMQCSGFLIDQKNDTVSQFHSLYFGIGKFYFAPLAEHTYHAVVKLADGKEINTPIPQAYADGYVMNVSDIDSTNLNVRVSSTFRSPSFLYLFVHTRHIIKMVLAGECKEGVVEFILNKKDLGDGISHLTIFNNSRRPVCERLYFKQPENNLRLNINTNKKEYSLRNKVNIELSLENPESATSESDISVSVHLLDSLQSTGQTDIINYLLLTSDIKGPVESPDFYFANRGTEINEAIDNLMLTQGWRRFKWEDILAGKKPSFAYIPEYEGQIIQGKVTDKKTGNPFGNKIVWLTVPGKKFHLGNALSNERGEVNFVVKDVYGPTEIILQSDSVVADSRIDILNPYSEQNINNSISHFSLPEKYGEQLKDRSINSQVVKAFETKEMQRYFIAGSTDSTQFYLEPDSRYYLDDYTRFPTMEEVMREFVYKVRVRKEQGKFRFEVLNTPYKSYFEKDPLVLLDGLPIFNTDKIISFDPLKVKSIDVIARKYYYENKMNFGIVSYRTYDGDLGTFELDPNSVILEYEGLQLEREFYSPVYDSQLKMESSIPDRRDVLLWYAGTRTNNSKINLSFYTSDIAGNYIIEAEGINAEGKPFKSLKIITVTK